MSEHPHKKNRQPLWLSRPMYNYVDGNHSKNVPDDQWHELHQVWI